MQEWACGDSRTLLCKSQPTRMEVTEGRIRRRRRVHKLLWTGLRYLMYYYKSFMYYILLLYNIYIILLCDQSVNS